MFGIAALAMRRAGSEWEWSFTGGNEIASGYRTGFAGVACTPPSRRELQEGEALTVDLHAMFKLGLGDHAHNYLIGPASDRQKWHARNFVDIVGLTLETYRAGITPSDLAEQMIGFADERGFADYMVPYWTNPEHVYLAGELIICALQYACPDESIGFRYENPIVLHEARCEPLSQYPLDVEVID